MSGAARGSAAPRGSPAAMYASRMQGSRPSLDEGIVALDSSLLVDDDRASLLDAAANARSAATLTGTHGVVALPLDNAAVRLPAPRDLLEEGTEWEERDGETETTALLRARAASATKGTGGRATDPVTLMRAHLELAHAQLADGDLDAARASATTATAAVDHAPAAHALLRMLASGRERAPLDAQLAAVEHIAAHVSDALVRADFLAEKGRLLEAQSGPSPESAAAFVEALALVPDHAGALAGLEPTLESLGRFPELASLLGRLAGLAGASAPSAWLQIERALILDRRLGDPDTARSGIDRALELAPGIGPVRQAATDFAVVHEDAAQLASLLASEAALESDPVRAACLELDGALAYLRAGDDALAIKLLEHAHARGRTSRVVDARVASELAHLLDKASRPGDALRVRKAALANVSGPRVELLALRALAAVAERAGELPDAVLALERARVLDSDDATLLEELDRLLVAAGRHEARAVLWMRESALADDSRGKTRALLIAADASAAAGRPAEAARHREAAWMVDPSAPGVFDSLAERLSPTGSREAVAARVELYAKALERTSDAGKRVYYAEKIAWLWDDVADDAALAAQAYEDVLALDPQRRSAIAGLASAASRARDGKKLARALLAEADVTADEEAQADARLRAAEALAEVDPERSLALAEEIAKGRVTSGATRARELVTRLHSAAGRWELVVASLAERGRAEKRKPTKIALALAEALTLSQRLGAPERALRTLEAARELGPDDPAIAAAIVSSLEAMGDDEALRTWLERLAADAADAEERVSYLVHAAEIAERREDGDDEAVRLYLLAREALPSSRLVLERLIRLGARADVPAEIVPPLLAAVRSLEVAAEAERVSAETLLVDRARDFATLRVAERLARAARSAPQLANALALSADATEGMLTMRALSALAAVVAWMLPEGDDLAPWDRLLALGSRDAVVLDELVRRTRRRVAAGDRSAIILASEATKRRLEGAADDTERVVLRIELARLHQTAGALRDAAVSARDALGIEPSSAGAAVLLSKVAAGLGDRDAARLSATTLAQVTRSPTARAALLRDAADLAAAEGDAKGAAVLLERALEADPEAVLVAARLAQIQATAGAWSDLSRALRRGLFAARTPEAVVPMAAELADVAKIHLRDPLLAIEALEHSRAIAPSHVPALFLLAELYIGQRAWEQALRALGDVVTCTTERGDRLIALCGRASILAKVLDRHADAETELRAALEIDPHELKALRGLLALSSLDSKERAEQLARLVVSETDRAARLDALLELARLRRELGDPDGAEGALVEAAALSPDPAMLARLREAAGGSAEAAARIVRRAVTRARESGAVPGAAWLASLGDLELDLGRLDQAIEHFEEALALEPSREPARLSLARALSAKGRHETAAAALTPLLDGGANGYLDLGFVRQLDEAFTGAGHKQQALVARELRGVAGDLDAAGLASLQTRRPMQATNSETLSGASLRSFVMPAGIGKHPIWDAAALGASLAGKLSRIGLSEQGATSRDRIKPRTVNPIRELFDRVTRAFELADVELAVSEHAVAPIVACEDATWVVVPTSLGDWPEAHAIAALARPLARIALGIPWLGALPGDEAIAILIALARQVSPSVHAVPAERVEALAGDYEPRVKRALDRKKKKALEEIEGSLSHAPPIALEAFIEAVLRTEARAAFLLSGDLRASLDALAITEQGLADALRVPGRAALAAVLARPPSRDLVTFAMGADATALRRSLGTLWG